MIATGAEPYRAPFPGAALPGVFTLRSLGDAEAIKSWIKERNVKKAAVIGGGYIGIECAENLKKRGIDTFIVEMGGRLMTPFDPEVAARIQRHIEENGVGVQVGCQVRNIDDAGGLAVQTCPERRAADMVILAAGVRPDTGLAQAAGLEMNKKGSIVTDAGMRTSDPDIYAVGDAVQVTNFVTGEPDFVPLAGPAGRQGRIAAENILGAGSRYDGAQGSGILRVFGLTAACTGINEERARRRKIDCGSVDLEYPSHAGYYPGAEEIFMKAVFEKGTGKILGAQFTGRDGVDKRRDRQRPDAFRALLRSPLRHAEGYSERRRRPDRKKARRRVTAFERARCRLAAGPRYLIFYTAIPPIWVLPSSVLLTRRQGRPAPGSRRLLSSSPCRPRPCQTPRGS